MRCRGPDSKRTVYSEPNAGFERNPGLEGRPVFDPAGLMRPR